VVALRPPLGEQHQGEALVPKSSRPVERVPLGGVFLQYFAISSDGLFQFLVPLSRSPSLKSAMPRLFWVTAHSRGVRPRVLSFGEAMFPQESELRHYVTIIRCDRRRAVFLMAS
jgi:hypothetical protein